MSYGGYCLLRRDVIYFGRYVPVFRRKLLPAYWG